MEKPTPASVVPFLESNRNPACALCPLHASATTRCLPTRPADYCVPGTHTQALLILGQGPGFEEDLGGKCFIGRTGELLHSLTGPEGLELHSVADVYLGNASRCRPPKDGEPTAGQCRTCLRTYFLRDLALLQSAYREVTVLLTGSKAISGLLRCKFKDAIAHQGHRIRPLLADSAQVAPFPVFSTYHIAYLLPGRNPTALRSVLSHMMLAREYLGGTLSQSTDAPQVEVALPVSAFPAVGYLCLDIETYGALAKYNQTVFDPERSVVVDRCPPKDLVQTVSLCFRDPTTHRLRTSVYVWSDPTHRHHLEDWLVRLAANHGTLLGMNLPFDVRYLRYCSTYLRAALCAQSGLCLNDLALDNYLHDEQRPERSLKSLSPLFRAGNYDADHALPDYDAADDRDPRLWAYNCQDTYRTYTTHLAILDAIRQDYGIATAKLSPHTDTFLSEELWTLIHMAEAGMAFDRPKLESLEAHQTRIVASTDKCLRAKYGLTPSGPGSQKSLADLFIRASQEAQESLDALERIEFIRSLELTKKTRKVSTGKENLSLLRGSLPAGPTRRALLALEKHRQAGHMISSYTNPLLRVPLRGIVRDDLAFPQWYPCPSRSQDADSHEGGTMQGRCCAQRPGIQTAPPAIKKCFRSRFAGGELWSYDMSQLELRVAALCLGDPIMLEDYTLGGTGEHDRHTHTGNLIQHRLFELALIPQILPIDHPTFKRVYRQMGKRVNFLMLYRGGAFKLSWAIRHDLGLQLPVPVSQSIIDAYAAAHSAMFSWQDSLVSEAIRLGFLELITGRSRSFLGGEEAIRQTYINEICNFPVQSYAGDLLLDSQALIRQHLEANRLHSVMPSQTYDQVFIDIYPDEKSEIDLLVDRSLTRPLLLTRLEEHYGRTCPLTYEAKRYA